jgi:uncharacterized protein (TIGR03067 family)
MMTDIRRCPQCGVELAADVPAGLCPECLLKQGFASEQAGNSGTQPQDSSAKPDAIHGLETVAPSSEQDGGPGVAHVAEPADSGGYRGPFTAPTPEELARHFPQLEIIELLGQGGMGAVYKARQPRLDRFVAVKILPPDAARDPAFAERFDREARALAKINHPNIVAVYDSGQHNGLYYFIMEYVDGVNLRELIRSGQCKPEEALRIVPQICEALQFAHDEGIVHRDIKPENILLDKRGRLKIADFGLARLLGHTRTDYTLTGPWQVMGTPNYMAPEQMDDPLKVDHRADIYALGVVFYEMLTGELPRGRFAPPSQKVQVDVRLDEVVLRALEQEPQRRYQQASDVKTDVENISRSPQPPSVARPESAKGVESRDVAPATPFDDSGRATRSAISARASGLTWAASILVCLVGVVSSISVPWLEVRDVDGGGFVQWHAFDLKEAMLAAFGFLACGVVLLVLPNRGQAPLWRAAWQIGMALQVMLATLVFFTESRAEFTSPEGTRALNFAFTEHGEQYDMRNSRPPELAGPVGPHFTLVWGVVLLFLGAWHLRTALSQRVERGQFTGGSPTRPQPPTRDIVQAPADAMMLVAGAALLTAIGLAIWLWAKWNAGLVVANTRFTLVGMSVTQAVYALVMVAGGLVMRSLRFRIFALLCTVIVGLFVPAAVALNVVMEFSHIPQWPVVIPMWLGVPVAVWATIVLFRRDVRAAFTEQMRMETSLSSEVRQPRGARRWLILSIVLVVVVLTTIAGLIITPRSPGAATAQLTFKVAGPHVDVSLNGQKAAMSADGAATMRLRPGDYETTILKGNVLQKRVYEFFYAGAVKFADERNADTIWVKGPLTLEFEPVSGRPTVPDYTAIQGRWNIVSQVKDGGFLMESQRSKWLEIDKDVMRGDRPAEPHTQPFFTESRFAINSDTTPRQFDYTDLGSKGIYRLDGDTLTLAVADAGQPRPTEFRSVAGSKVMLTICRRANAPASKSSVANSPAQIDINGDWDSKWRKVTFQHTVPKPGDVTIAVKGTYYEGSGTIEGMLTIATRKFEGRFRENSGMNGPIRLVVSADGRSIQGRYNYRQAADDADPTDLNHPWDMMRVGGDSTGGPSADVNSAALLAAAAAGQVDRIKQLLDAGASVNAKDADGQTPLMKAVAGGHRSLAITLVMLGADLTEQDNRGLTAIMIAAERRDSAFLSRLSQLSFVSYDQDAAERKEKLQSLPGVDRTLLAGRDIDLRGIGFYEAELLKDRNGENALMKAARAGDWDSINTLAIQVDSMLARDKFGRTVLMHAVLGDSIEQGRWMEQFEWLNKPPYFGVAGLDNIYIGPMLMFELDRGLSVLDNDGNSVLQLAEQHGREKIAAVLRRQLEEIVKNQTAEIDKGGESVAKNYRLRGLAWRALGEKAKAASDLQRAGAGGDASAAPNSLKPVRTLAVGAGAWSVVVSPDGKLLAANGAKDDSSVLKVWDIETLTETLTIDPKIPVRQFAFTHDSRQVVTAGDDETVKLFDLATSTRVGEFAGHRASCVAVSPDGKHLATGGPGGTLVLWDFAERKVEKILGGHSDEVRSVAFSPDGTKLASGGLDKIVRIWSVETGKPLFAFDLARDRIEQVAFSPDGKSVAAASWDRMAWRWNVETGEDLGPLRAHTDKLTGVAFDPTGRLAATSCWDGTVALWDLSTMHVVATFDGAANQAFGVVFLSDGKRIATAHRDGVVKVWTVPPTLLDEPGAEH